MNKELAYVCTLLMILSWGLWTGYNSGCAWSLLYHAGTLVIAYICFKVMFGLNPRDEPRKPHQQPGRGLKTRSVKDTKPSNDIWNEE